MNLTNRFSKGAVSAAPLVEPPWWDKIGDVAQPVQQRVANPPKPKGSGSSTLPVSAKRSTKSKKNHEKCYKQAMKLIQRAAFDVYCLFCMAKDKCPHAPDAEKLKALEELIDSVRRQIRERK